MRGAVLWAAALCVSRMPMPADSPWMIQVRKAGSTSKKRGATGWSPLQKGMGGFPVGIELGDSQAGSRRSTPLNQYPGGGLTTM